VDDLEALAELDSQNGRVRLGVFHFSR